MRTPYDPAETPQEHNYIVTAEIQFSVRATSITKSYKEFEKWMVQAFHNSFKSIDDKPAIAPSYYEGIAITKVEKKDQ